MCTCNSYIKIKRYSYKNEGHLDPHLFSITKVISLHVSASALRSRVILHPARVYDPIYLVLVSIFFSVGGLSFVRNDRYTCEK